MTTNGIIRIIVAAIFGGGFLYGLIFMVMSIDELFK